VAINMPIFKDTNTPSPFIDPTIPWDRDVFPEDKEAKEGAAKPDHIYMDAMAFGMGCCCLQITFQACNVEEARRLYDQLAPVGAIMVRVHDNTSIQTTAKPYQLICPASVGFDRSGTYLSWLFVRCRLQMECHCQQR
jgi:hypothetical protein